MSRKLKFASQEERELNNKKYAKQYYEANKDKITANLYTLVHCNCCNEDIKKYKIQRHERSNKHKKNAEKLIVSLIKT